MQKSSSFSTTSSLSNSQPKAKYPKVQFSKILLALTLASVAIFPSYANNTTNSNVDKTKKVYKKAPGYAVHSLTELFDYCKAIATIAGSEPNKITRVVLEPRSYKEELVYKVSASEINANYDKLLASKGKDFLPHLEEIRDFILNRVVKKGKSSYLKFDYLLYLHPEIKDEYGTFYFYFTEYDYAFTHVGTLNKTKASKYKNDQLMRIGSSNVFYLKRINGGNGLKVGEQKRIPEFYPSGSYLYKDKNGEACIFYR